MVAQSAEMVASIMMDFADFLEKQLAYYEEQAEYMYQKEQEYCKELIDYKKRLLNERYSTPDGHNQDRQRDGTPRGREIGTKEGRSGVEKAAKGD